MPSTHPLELPEIVLSVALFVPQNSLPACALVSKAWHQIFNPFIWRVVKLDSKRPYPPKAIQNHCELVKALVIRRVPTLGHTTLRYPKLVSLEARCSLNGPDIMKFVDYHPFITHLSLWSFWPKSQPCLWDKLLGLRNLKALALSCLVVGEEDADKFWKLCTDIERLDIRHLRITGRGTLSSREFRHIKELTLGLFDGVTVPLCIEFMQKCPGLTSFEWTANREVDKHFIPKLTRLIAARTWPDLHRMFVGTFEITDSDLSMIIGSMQRITAFHHYSSESFGQKSMEQLQPHFSNLRVLDIRPKDDTINAIGQEVLSSCPLLERLTAPRVDGTAVADGKPWVCSRLKALEISFCFDPSTIQRIQPLVLDQLSKLTRLQELNMWGLKGPHFPIESRFQGSIDLRLENGLEKLSTLRALRIITFKGTEQRMGEREIDWILEYWTNLECVYGTLNEWELQIDKRLKERLQMHGIST
ncbi:hypothetical protein BGZ65_003573 [Modicella reniformis]|uniref:F-box domain-containing protein n=1 Tax=Modicella reniformis TaxID=1440133 RepID=A0A9P6M971_9FUNG|nr:hypothetical protein BGZ65_003573 [Modicella reniformis]